MVFGLSRFSVQLTDTFQVDIGLFFSPIITWGADSGTVVMNIRCSGSWGREEREKDAFPFKASEEFIIEITILEDRYKVRDNEGNLSAKWFYILGKFEMYINLLTSLQDFY